MAHRAQTFGAREIVAQLAGDPPRRAGQPFRLGQIGVDEAPALGIEACHGLGLPEGTSSAQNLMPAERMGLVGQLFHQTFGGYRGMERAAHQNPFPVKIFLSFFRQRPRMNPIEPRGQAEPLRYIRVRQRRLLEKQQLDQLAAALGKLADGFTHHLFPLQSRHHVGRQGLIAGMALDIAVVPHSPSRAVCCLFQW